MQVRDVMSTEIKSILHSDSVSTFLAELEKHEISGMPVMDADGRVLGVATMTDVGKVLRDPPLLTEEARDFYSEVEEGADRTLELAKVADIMTEHIVMIVPGADMTELTALMANDGIHRVFVMDGEQIVGVVTSLDLVKAFGEHLAREAHPVPS